VEPIFQVTEGRSLELLVEVVVELLPEAWSRAPPELLLELPQAARDRAIAKLSKSATNFFFILFLPFSVAKNGKTTHFCTFLPHTTGTSVLYENSVHIAMRIFYE
jgi:hypothetical protein